MQKWHTKSIMCSGPNLQKNINISMYPQKVTKLRYFNSQSLTSLFNCQAEATFRSELEPAGITVESRTFKTTEDPADAIRDLFVSSYIPRQHELCLTCNPLYPPSNTNLMSSNNFFYIGG